MRGSLRHPARLMPLGFLVVITIGTLLLSSPLARAGPHGAPVLTALFTTVSAVCVTGLAIEDTSTYWSNFGQVVILGLIQIGGFGIMTFASFLGLFISRRLGLGRKLATQTETKTLDLGDIRGILWRLAIIVFTVEAAVAAVLTARFVLGYDYPVSRAIWHGIFHAVSAFNNAGFALHADSLERFVTDEWVLLPLALAVIIGGAGFPVIIDLLRKARHPRRWSMHTKLTVLGTVVLLAVGFVSYLVLEWGNRHTLGQLGSGDKLTAAFFSGVMPRTAGFNAVPTGELETQTLAITDMLMFIGGGSAGTAGGVKVTTFLLLAFVIWSEIRGESDVTVFGRRVGSAVQRQALTVALLGVALVAAGTTALLIISDFSLDRLLFETISAFSTTGLSTGITAQLPVVGQLILIALMYTGRVGTITVAAALALRNRRRRFRYPEERPIVG